VRGCWLSCAAHNGEAAFRPWSGEQKKGSAKHTPLFLVTRSGATLSAMPARGIRCAAMGLAGWGALCVFTHAQASGELCELLHLSFPPIMSLDDSRYSPVLVLRQVCSAHMSTALEKELELSLLKHMHAGPDGVCDVPPREPQRGRGRLQQTVREFTVVGEGGCAGSCHQASEVLMKRQFSFPCPLCSLCPTGPASRPASHFYKTLLLPGLPL
jgi:hypothetical protein